MRLACGYSWQNEVHSYTDANDPLSTGICFMLGQFETPTQPRKHTAKEKEKSCLVASVVFHAPNFTGMASRLGYFLHLLSKCF